MAHESNRLPVQVSVEPQAPTGDPFIDSVVQVIVASLREGEPSVRSTASSLGMSERTLQRRLGLHGTTHRQLLEAARHRLATALLAVPESTVTQVAVVLGYNGHKALCRAFRRWTGTTPRALVPRSEAGD
jgi:AraC-like DNA-binding protein